MSKILGIDYGDKRVGLALSDEDKKLAVVWGVMNQDHADIWRDLGDLIAEEDVELIVVGLPLNMAGERTNQTEESHQFAQECAERFGIAVDMIDERLTSIEAQGLAQDMKHANRDAIAALLILQSYLDKNALC